MPPELPALEHEPDTSLPFFEAYFSNFIEGTEFSVVEAEAIVVSGEVPDDRPEDAHDILGTFEAVRESQLRAAVPTTADEQAALLERRHRLIMGGRPEKRPGQFKEKPNRAGSYVFVAAALVEGTLSEGFRRLVDLPPGFARAAFGLFLISEVHPYDDGNGRVARAAMCAELTAADQARIVIPIVFRDEYQTALRTLSREGRCDLYVRTLAYGHGAGPRACPGTTGPPSTATWWRRMRWWIPQTLSDPASAWSSHDPERINQVDGPGSRRRHRDRDHGRVVEPIYKVSPKDTVPKALKALG